MDKIQNRVRLIWPYIYNGTIFLTLILCLILMLKYFFFKNADIDSFGSVTDWISALCSIATLIIATIAYYKWQDNKYRDDSYEIQKTLIAKNYITLFNQLDELRFKFNSINNKFNSIDHCYYESVINKLVIDLNLLSSNLEKNASEIKDNIRIIAVFNCHPNETFNNINHNILFRVESLITITKTVSLSLEGLQMSQMSFHRKKSLQSLKYSLNASVKSFALCNKGKDYIYHPKRTLHELFMIGGK